MTIPWTNCSERMPPDDENFSIITYDDFDGLHTDDGKALRTIYEDCIIQGTIWAPYTPEDWAELNRK